MPTLISPSDIDTSQQFSFANVVIDVVDVSVGVIANGTLGTAGQVLTSNGTASYWGAGGGGGGGGNTYSSIAAGISTITASSADSTLTIANSAGVTTSVSNNVLYLGVTEIAKQSLTGNGSNTQFTLTYSTTADDIFVYVNGSYLHPDEGYTVSNTTLTFTTAPVNTSQIRIRFMRAPSGLIALLGDISSGSGEYDMSTQAGPPVDLNA